MLILSGAALTLVGVAVLIFCIIRAFRLRNSHCSEREMKRGLQRLVVFNLGAVALSALGLITAVLGIMLS